MTCRATVLCSISPTEVRITDEALDMLLHAAIVTSAHNTKYVWEAAPNCPEQVPTSVHQLSHSRDLFMAFVVMPLLPTRATAFQHLLQGALPLQLYPGLYIAAFRQRRPRGIARSRNRAVRLAAP